MKSFRPALLSAALLAALPLMAQAQQAPDAEATPQPKAIEKVYFRGDAPTVTVRAEKIEMDGRRIAMDAERASRDAQRAAREAVEATNFDIAFIGQELGRGRVVKGAPYCAEAVHETVQPLADGNRIVRSQVDKLCRDGEGRTRQEVERDGKKVVYLRDPVSKENWVLDPETKTARKAGGMAFVTQDDGQWKVFGAQVREMATKVRDQIRVEVGGPAVPPAPPAAPATPKPPLPPEPVVLTEDTKGCDPKDVPKEAKDGKTKVKCEVRVQVLRMEPAGKALPPLPALQAPPAVLARNVIFAPRGDGSTSSLGAKEIEGVKVNGERTSWTIEAGKIGNEKPIVITSDVWTSPDLMVTVSSRDFDPRSGETNYRLQNIKRSEPDSALMKLPADYKKEEGRQEVRIRTTRDAAPAPKAAAKP